MPNDGESSESASTSSGSDLLFRALRAGAQKVRAGSSPGWVTDLLEIKVKIKVNLRNKVTC